MAKNNKYASINFNHIYEKTNQPKNPSLSPSPSSSSSSSSSYSSASYSSVSAPNKPHGRILVLTRPTPKPVAPPTPPPSNPIQKQLPDQPPSEPGSEAISLRPLGRTGTGSSLSSVSVLNHDKEKDLPSPQPPKTDKFVPPHLRPGFVPREEGPGPEPVRFRENGRPKSGGHERMRKGGGPDVGIVGRGNRPSSSGS
ncbi:serine/arginine repetitive matrix protein 2 [Abrus precatorius]|uniref:Serine/arginine repetitive matrix protein 2 n=1 Tax=Abrus precatorius TaxID=3816 RepID=A0A8B8KFF7_ABRPR|nr:serine/arginine repetitive matrix protein 2 [Abrus precatorius]